VPIYALAITTEGTASARPFDEWTGEMTPAELALQPVPSGHQWVATVGWAPDDLGGEADDRRWWINPATGVVTAQTQPRRSLEMRRRLARARVQQALADEAEFQALDAEITPASRRAKAAWRRDMRALIVAIDGASDPEATVAAGLTPAPAAVAAAADLGQEIERAALTPNAVENWHWQLGADGLAGWSYAETGVVAPASSVSVTPAGANWAGHDLATGRLSQADAARDGSAAYSQLSARRILAEGSTDWRMLRLRPGDTVGVHAHLSVHRCDGLFGVWWVAEDDTVLGSAALAIPSGWGSGPSTRPEEWPQAWLRAARPADGSFAQPVAYAAGPFLRKHGTVSGTNSFMFVALPWLGRVGAGAPGPGPWLPPAPRQVRRDMLVAGLLGRRLSAVAAGPFSHVDSVLNPVARCTLALGPVPAGQLWSVRARAEARRQTDANPTLTLKMRSTPDGVAWTSWARMRPLPGSIAVAGDIPFDWSPEALAGEIDVAAAQAGVEIRIEQTGTGAATSAEVLRNIRIEASFQEAT
jgi:hypothetical protein